MWHRIGVCSETNIGDDRLWHAALSADGRYALVFSWSEECVLWDVFASRKVLEIGDEYPPLEEWLDSEGLIHLKSGPHQGRYRVFGIDHDRGKRTCPNFDLDIAIDCKRSSMIVKRLSTGEQLEALPYEAFSGDWAFCSLSENCEVIAVIEPYFVTFFSRETSRGGLALSQEVQEQEFHPGEAYAAIDRAFAEGWNDPKMDDYDRYEELKG